MLSLTRGCFPYMGILSLHEDAFLTRWYFPHRRMLSSHGDAFLAWVCFPGPQTSFLLFSFHVITQTACKSRMWIETKAVISHRTGTNPRLSLQLSFYYHSALQWDLYGVSPSISSLPDALSMFAWITPYFLKFNTTEKPSEQLERGIRRRRKSHQQIRLSSVSRLGAVDMTSFAFQSASNIDI